MYPDCEHAPNTDPRHSGSGYWAWPGNGSGYSREISGCAVLFTLAAKTLAMISTVHRIFMLTVIPLLGLL